MARFSETMNKKSKIKEKIIIASKFKRLVNDFTNEHSDVLKKLANR